MKISFFQSSRIGKINDNVFCFYGSIVGQHLKLLDIFGLVFEFLKDIKDIDGFDFTILTGTRLGFVVIDKLRVEILRIGLKSERIS